MKKSSLKGGFTIVELVIVIAVIAILAALIIPTVGSFVNKAELTASEVDKRNLSLSVKMYGDQLLPSEALNAAHACGYDSDSIRNLGIVGWNYDSQEFVTEVSSDVWVFVHDARTFLFLEGGKYCLSELCEGSVYISDACLVDYACAKPGSVIVNHSNSSQTILHGNADNITVTAPFGSVAHYGKAVSISITSTTEYSEYGSAELISIQSGKLIIQAHAQVDSVLVGEGATCEISPLAKVNMLNGEKYPPDQQPTIVPLPQVTDTEFEYDGQNHSPQVETSDHYVVICDEQMQAGEYTMTLRLRKQCIWEDGDTQDKVIVWHITPIRVDFTLGDPRIYNGKAQSADLPCSDLFTVECDEQTDAGIYTATLILNDKVNTVWQDGTSQDKTIEWEITALTVQLPQLSNTQIIYDGQEHMPEYTDSEYYTVHLTSEINAGKYEAVFRLSGKEGNCIWSDGSSDEYVLEWKILKAEIQITMPTTLSMEYDGEEKTVMESGEKYTVTGNSATDAGSYTCEIQANDESNYSVTLSSFEWEITKAKISKPSEQTIEYKYTGEQITIELTIDGTTVEGNTGVEEGEYTALFTPDKNHTWSDGSSESCGVVWKIVKDKASVSVYDLTQSTPTLEGEGSEEEPYLIKHANQLSLISSVGYYKLCCDVDMNKAQVSITEFGGSLEGDGHSISNMSVPLFRSANGCSISNLEIKSAILTSNDGKPIGALIDQTSEIMIGKLKISNVTAEVEIRANGGCVGGLIGMSVDAEISIEGCKVTGKIENNGTEAGTMGGIIGYMSQGSIENSTTQIELNGNGTKGGIVGRSIGTVTVKSCTYPTIYQAVGKPSESTIVC